jgi:hypothetical protein
MVMPQVHRMFFHYTEFPLSLRTLFTATLVMLGIGYVFAMIQIYAVHSGLDGKSGLSADDIAIAYSGNRNATRLQAALVGPMSAMIPPDEAGTIISWVRGGIDKSEYMAKVKPIIDKRCLFCHNGSNAHVPNLDGYENIAKVAQIDTGMSLYTLIRVSHIHIFGMTFIFFVMGLIFSHAYVRPVWFKSAVIVLPFLSMIIDVGSWYLTKINTAFAWAIIIGGGLMALSFAIQWIVSIYQIWFYTYTAGQQEHPAKGITV